MTAHPKEKAQSKAPPFQLISQISEPITYSPKTLQQALNELQKEFPNTDQEYLNKLALREIVLKKYQDLIANELSLRRSEPQTNNLQTQIISALAEKLKPEETPST